MVLHTFLCVLHDFAHTCSKERTSPARSKNDCACRHPWRIKLDAGWRASTTYCPSCPGMLRIHSADTHGWSTMQRTRNTQELGNMINQHIELMPGIVALTHSARSLQIVSAGAILNMHILKTGAQRSDEHCVLEQCEYTCWCVGTVVVWQRKSNNAENFASCTYYEEHTSGHHDDNVTTRLARVSSDAGMRRIAKSKRHASICRQENCVGRVLMNTFVITLVQSATHVVFISDRSIARHSERNAFSAPRAVNICYTGTVDGQIEQSAISAEMTQAKKNGPCGSEIHIDTSMGVMQIFGNNSGSRKITCKAFLNITEADFIVDRVCGMVLCCFPHCVPRFVHTMPRCWCWSAATPAW